MSLEIDNSQGMVKRFVQYITAIYKAKIGKNLGALFYMQSLQAIGACFHGISLSQGLVMSLFLAGLVGGFSHCVAMCGPFVMAQSGHVEKLSQAVLLPYHLGRITTYTTLAALISSVFNLVFLYMPVRAYVVAPVLVLAGLIFFVSAFPQLGKLFPWVSAVKISLPYRWFSKGFQKLSHNPNGFKRFGMGLLLGFLPFAQQFP
mgnify:FL=1